MLKKSSSVFSIVYKSFAAYFYRLPQFLKYMLYPAFGWVFGIVLIFLPFLIAKTPEEVNLGLAFVGLIFGLVIFCHSFWKYLLVSGALVIISKKIIENEETKEFGYYTEGFSKRSKEYIKYLFGMIFVPVVCVLLYSVAAIIIVILSALLASALGVTLQEEAMTKLVSFGGAFLMTPLFIVTLQSFVLSPNLTVFQSIKKGMKLAFRGFFPSWGLIILILVIGVLWGQLIAYLLTSSVFSGVSSMPGEITGDFVMKFFIYLCTCVGFGILLLPFSTICYTWWYLRLEKEANAKKAGYRR